MATLKLPDGRMISFPDGLQPEQVKKIIGAATAAKGGQPAPQATPAPNYDPSGILTPSDVAAKDPNATFGQRAAELGINTLKSAANTYNDVTGGMANIIAHPIDTATGVASAVMNAGEHPGETAAAVGNKAANFAQAFNGANPGTELWKDPVGYTVDAASIAVPLKEGLTSLVTKSPVKVMEKAAPSAADVEQAKNLLYKRLEDAGVRYHVNDFQQFANNVANDIGGKLDNGLHPQTAAVAKKMGASLSVNPSLTTIEDYASELKGILRSSAEPRDKFMAGRVLDHLSDFMDKAAPMTGSMTQPEVQATLAAARDLGRSHAINRDIQEMAGKAGGYVSGDESGMRNQFASYYKSPEGQSMKPLEKAAFQRVIRREGPLNPLHMAGSRLGMLLLQGIGAGSGSIPGFLAGTGASMAARKLGEVLTNRAVGKATSTVLAGREAQAKALAELQKLSSGRQRALLAAALLAAEKSQSPQQ